MVTKRTEVRRLALKIASHEPFTRKVNSVSAELLDLCDAAARIAVTNVLIRACNQNPPGNRRLGPPTVP